MSSNVSGIRRGAFIEGVLTTLFLVFLINWFFETETPTFTFSFQTINTEIDTVTIISEELEILFSVESDFAANFGELEFVVPSKQGVLDLKVLATDGRVFYLKRRRI
ncbi:hypothetical protein OAP14_07035 [Aliiglaciecola sp.]|nr:hypothetical protein [Aliiglaciecola sp.]